MTTKPSLFRQLFSSKNRKQRRRQGQRRLFTERLEDRRLLAFGFMDSGQLLTGVDPTGGGSSDVILEDFDGDGDLDAAVANRQQNFAGGLGDSQVYLNDGTGNFPTSNALPGTPVGFTEDLEAGDIDGDGDLDLVAAHWRFDWPQVFVNDGNANFTTSATLSGQRALPRGSDLGDVDGDGDLDIVFASARTIYANDGSGSFSSAGTIGAAVGDDMDVDLVDLDGDNDLDAIFSRFNLAGNEVWMNDGAGNFTFAQTLVPSNGGATIYQIATADVDGDGDIDVLNNASGDIDVWQNDGAGNLTLTSTVNTTSRHHYRVVPGDVDGDGDIDFYASARHAEIFLNDGSGAFSAFVNPTAFPDDHSAALGDLDADGDLDLFQGLGGGPFGRGAAPDRVWFNGLDPVSNQPPEITVDAATVTVDEGQTANNSGTVSDPDGDTVLLDVSAGSVANNNDGTWSWSLATDDGPAEGISVTIVGDDGNSGTDDVSFTLVVNNLAPDASASGPASALIGESVTVTLGATDASSTDQAAGFDYDIDWDGNGTIDQTVSGADGTTVNHAFAVGGAMTVIVTATDKDGGTSDTVSFEINVIQPVDVDVKPGNSQNKVNAKSQGFIPVAIYTTSAFDAADVDASTVRLSGIEADHFSLEDVDGDGDLDLILHFAVQDLLDALALDLDSGDAESVDVELTGETNDDVDIFGSNTVNFFFPGKGKGKK
ncbi:MAG: VCBS repeat-containing protein [Planctomycetes bacterium]|nr:VCBS repeat-containing protein [Planctomycetota bacterium]